MSPAAKTARKKGDPFKIEAKGPRGGSTKDVKVEQSGKNIIVTWICGGTRTFNVDRLRECITHVSGAGSTYDMWLNLSDSGENGFWVHIKDGELTANDDMGDNGTVPWADLQRALQATIAEVLS